MSPGEQDPPRTILIWQSQKPAAHAPFAGYPHASSAPRILLDVVSLAITLREYIHAAAVQFFSISSAVLQWLLCSVVYRPRGGYRVMDDLKPIHAYVSVVRVERYVRCPAG